MKKKALRKTNYNKTDKIILVSNTNGKAVNISVAPWFRKAALVAATGVTIAAFSFASVTYEHMLEAKLSYSKNVEQISTLEEVYKEQKAEVEALALKATSMEQETVSNLETLAEMKSSVGMSGDVNPVAISNKVDEDVANLTSRNMTSEEEEIEDADLTAKLDGIATSMANLEKELANQTKDIASSATPIKSKYAYMQAIPSGMPIQDTIGTAFGHRKNPFTNRGSEFHKGVDIGATFGADVYATGAGTIIQAGWNGGFGNLVVIDHGYGFRTYYAHNSEIVVSIGDKVQRGDVLSKVGSTGRSTGPHVHYEVRIDGQPVNPADYF